MTLSSSLACSIASSSSLVSMFFLHAFLPFLDFCPRVAGAPRSSCAGSADLSEVNDLGRSRSYGFDLPVLDDPVDLDDEAVGILVTTLYPLYSRLCNV